MSASPDRAVHSPEARMESFWLPSDVQGNGLVAERWAEIIVVSQAHAKQLLVAFRAAGVPARVATTRRPVPGDQDTRIWVDPDHYGAAENVLLRELSR